MDVFEINGVTYQRKPEPKRSSHRMPPMFMGMMLMAEMSMPGYYGSNKKKEHTKVDIVEEYGLIQQKKSKLSRSQREWVVHTFERNFIIVPSAEEKI